MQMKYVIYCPWTQLFGILIWNYGLSTLTFKSILAKYKCLNAIMKKLYPKYFFFATLQLPKVLLKRISFLLQMTMLTFSNTIQIWNLSVIFERNKTKLLCCIFKFWMIKFKPCNAFKDKIWSLLYNSIMWYHISI